MEKTKRSAIVKLQPSLTSMEFPKSAICGSAGLLAETLASGSEVPVEFYLASIWTALGSIATGKLTIAAYVDSEPRLYTVLLGGSYEVKKSTAMRRTINLFEPLLAGRKDAFVTVGKVVGGVGSAEGLARELEESKHVLLCYDEMKALMDKSSIEGSVLLSMITSMFEGTRYSSSVKNAKKSINVTEGHLSILGCCTTDTYARMWTPEAIAIGLPNRLFVVSADRKQKVSWPKEPDPEEVRSILDWVKKQLTKLPLRFDITARARARWTAWYQTAPPSEHAKRLDTIGFRLMPLLALTTEKDIIDSEVIDTTIEILEYEIRLRQLTDPIDADNARAKMEIKIRRALASRGPLTDRDLRRATNADRAGLWLYSDAINKLKEAKELVLTAHNCVYSLIAGSDENE